MEYFKEESIVDISIIGGSDGSTSIFWRGRLAFPGSIYSDWIIVALLLIPNIIYAFKFRGCGESMQKQCK